jgi:hypothetical protein
MNSKQSGKTRMVNVNWIKFVIFSSLMALSAQGLAEEWRFFQSVKITSMIQWQDNSDVLIEVAPNTHCYVTANEKTLIALLTTLYTTGRKANFHCHSTAITTGGISAHRLHRVVAL